MTVMLHYFVILLAALCCIVPASAAENFPNRRIKIVIPFAPGGTAEPLARMLADSIQKRTGAVVIVESRPGAGGNIGAAEVANSDKDGYTLLLGANNNFVVNQYLFKNNVVDPETKFDLISILADQFQVVYVNADFPANTMNELLNYIKVRPGQINFASPGVGSAPHLSGELLSDLYGLTMVHVPYKGGAPAITALLSGEVQLYLASLSVGSAQIKTGKLKALAVTSPKRMKSLPDVPTTRESGAPGYTVSNWWALATAKGTPAARIDWIRREFARALQDPATQSRLEDLGFTVNDGTTGEFEDRVRRESALYRELIQKRKLAVD
jgi:tripartite-type tricarboxylate transporter receptor subunit TctC